jgi:cell division protein FtsI (penicillin-binding protein 3)
MIDDELQVLGKPHKMSKKTKWLISISAIALMILCVVLGMIIHSSLSTQQTIKIKTGKKVGDPTIVPELQATVDSILNANMTEIGNCLQGQAIVIDVETGEILAMSGLERNFEGKFQPCKNFAYQQELGSLMKTASLLTLFERGIDSTYVVHTGVGVWGLDDNWVLRDHNWRRGGYGDMNIARALEVSSNIGIGVPVWESYKGHEQDFFDDLNKMSFGQPDFIDGIEGLKPTTYDSPKDSDWVNKFIIWSAIGYNRKIAPIQMLTFYNAIANDGKMVKPTLKTGEIEIINPQIASKDNIKKIQVILEHVVSQGLGMKAGTPILRVAGKTGTSQVNEYDYYNEVGTPLVEYQLAFCGYFPADKPKYSMIVSINKLGLPASGGGMAGVVFHDIMNWIITHDMHSLLVIDDETNDTIQITESTLNKASEILHRQSTE